MKKKLHMELLATSLLAILLTLLFAMVAFYGLFKEQIVNDLKADALVLKSMQVFDDMDAISLAEGELGPESLRVTVIGSDGDVLFDSSTDAAEMENHLDRPEVRIALDEGEGSGTRSSETLDKNLYYYAVRLDNGNVVRGGRQLFCRVREHAAGRPRRPVPLVPALLFPFQLLYKKPGGAHRAYGGKYFRHRDGGGL